MSKETKIKLEKIRKVVLDFILGKRCACCGKIIENNKDLCESCKDNILKNIDGCKRCGQPKSSCVCKTQRFEFTRIIAPYVYEGPVKSGIGRMKKEIGGDTAEYFADVITNQLKIEELNQKIDLIVCVPLTKEREKEKGYNQSGLLAKRISKNLDIPFNKSTIVKIYHNKEQHRCKALHRTGNVLGVYEANEEICNGKNLLLVDDVTTGGSTLNECAKMMKIAGAKSVYCAVVAITVNKQKCR